MPSGILLLDAVPARLLAATQTRMSLPHSAPIGNHDSHLPGEELSARDVLEHHALLASHAQRTQGRQCRAAGMDL